MSILMKKSVEKLQKTFDTKLLEKIALETGFIKRNRKLNATNFFKICVFNSDSICDISLNDLATQYKIESGKDISRQALNDRFNKEAVNFFRKIFQNVLLSHSKISNERIDISRHLFNRIRIMDSTTIELPNKFMNIYVGKGGGASKAAAKFNVEYDLLTGEFRNVGFSSGTKSDSDCMHDVIYDVDEKDLCIKDLGYFNLRIFDKINRKGAFYISKIKSNTGVYSDDLTYDEFYYHKYRKAGLR